MDHARGHRRRISFKDMEQTYRMADRNMAERNTHTGPMVAGPPNHAGQPTLTPAQIQQQQLEELRRRDHARRQSRKPTDKEIPDEIGDVVVGDGVQRYKQLRDVERRLDAVMMRKRLDISESTMRRNTRCEGLLRIWVSNTAEGQPWQVTEEGGGMGEDGTFDFGENSQATFRVKIEGKLLDDVEEEDFQWDSQPEERPKLSSFFKAITVDFDRNPLLQPDGYDRIEWRKPVASPQNPNVDATAPESSFDCLEFERKSDENINITINLVRDEKPERFKLSPQLEEVLDTQEEEMASVVQGIWEYCRAMGLQEDEEKRSIVCDDLLKRLFNKDKVYFPYVPDLIHPHLLPLDPIKLKYTIRVDKTYISPADDSDSKASAHTIYDIRVPLPNPLKAAMAKIQHQQAHLQNLQTIVGIDDQVALLVQKIHETNGKRKFYENLAKDPASFVKRWTSSQKRDLEVLLAEATRGGGEDGQNEEFRKGGKDGVWGGGLARESVGLWLARQRAH